MIRWQFVEQAGHPGAKERRRSPAPFWPNPARINRPGPMTSAIAAALVACLVNAPAMHAALLPSHDAFLFFSHFSVHARHLQQHGALPMWIPNASFGSPADWRQLLLSPAQWLFLPIATLLPGSHAVTVFKGSLFFQCLTFAIGCERLSRHLIRNAGATCLFLITVLATALAWKQAFFNSLALVPLPWIVLALTEGIRRRNRVVLAASLVFVPAVGFGGPFYWIPYLAMVWACIFGALVFTNRDRGIAWLWAVPRGREALQLTAIFVPLALMTTVMGLQLLEVTWGQQPVSPGRDLETGTVPLATFLSYGGILDLSRIAWSSAIGVPDIGHNAEIYLYCGLAVWSCSVIGLVLPRGPRQRAIRVVFVVGLAFATSGVIATVAYFLPGMRHFRHVAYTITTVHFFWSLLAGCGLERLCDACDVRQTRRVALLLTTPFIVSSLFVFFTPVASLWVPDAASRGKLQIDRNAWLPIATGVTALITSGIVAVVARFDRPWRRTVVLACMIGTAGLHASFLVVTAYRRDMWWASAEAVQYLQRATSLPLDYVPVRGAADPASERFLVELMQHGARYDITDALLCRDAPLTGERSDALPNGTIELLRLRGSDPKAFATLAALTSRKTYIATGFREVTDGAMDLDADSVILNVDGRMYAAVRAYDAHVSATSFSFNEVTFQLPKSLGARFPETPLTLVYHDAWHPDWSATVDGESRDVWKANLAFKAVRIEPGDTVVRMTFGSPYRRCLAWLNAIFAYAMALFPFGLLWCLREPRGRKDTATQPHQLWGAIPE